MKTTFLLPSLLAASCFFLAAPPAAAQKVAKPRQAQRARHEGVRLGEKVDWLARQKFQTSTGETFSFAQWFKPKKAGAEKSDRPRAVVVVFWSYTCPWEKAWDPELAAIAREYEPKGVRFAAIDSNVTEQKALTEIEASRKRNKLPFPVLLDPGHKVADYFGAKTTPHVYVIDGQGRVVYMGAPDDDPKKVKSAAERKTWLRDALDDVLAGRKVRNPMTRPQGCSIKRGPTEARSVEPTSTTATGRTARPAGVGGKGGGR